MCARLSVEYSVQASPESCPSWKDQRKSRFDHHVMASCVRIVEDEIEDEGGSTKAENLIYGSSCQGHDFGSLDMTYFP